MCLWMLIIVHHQLAAWRSTQRNDLQTGGIGVESTSNRIKFYDLL